MHNLEVKQIIATKKINKQKILLLLRKFIKLKFDNCIIVKIFTTKAKYLLVRDKIYIFRNKNNILRVNHIRF